MKIQIHSNTFILHYSGSIFWEDEKILLISDVHLGKISHFRKHGLAVPNQAIMVNFRRMQEVVTLFKPLRIIFLGDLFHSKINSEWKLFAEWTKGIDAQIILVEGNHDIIAKENYEELNIITHNRILIGQFLFTHHPEDNEAYFNICGHIHPGIKIRDVGRQSLKLPCFFKKENQLILPAFGEFTGNYFIQPKATDAVYALVDETVIKVV